MRRFVFAIFTSVFAFLFFSCADILEKKAEIKLVLPPLAPANTFFSFGTPLQPDQYTCKEAHAFAFLCREIPLPDGVTLAEPYKGEVYRDLTNSYAAWNLEFNEETTFQDMSNTFKRYQAEDPYNEIICFTGVSNIQKSDEVTITLPPVNFGTEFYVLVYVYQKLEEKRGTIVAPSPWFRFRSAYSDDSGSGYVPQKITASENYQTVSLVKEQVPY